MFVQGLDGCGRTATVILREWNVHPSHAWSLHPRPGVAIETLVDRDERGRPVVSVQDASSHSLAWIGSALGVRQIALGVDRFGESGRIKDLYDIVGISTDHIVNAGLLAAEG